MQVQGRGRAAAGSQCLGDGAGAGRGFSRGGCTFCSFAPQPEPLRPSAQLGEAVLTQPRLIFDPFLFSSSPPPPLQPSGVQMELSPTSFCQEQSWAACSLGGGRCGDPTPAAPVLAAGAAWPWHCGRVLLSPAATADSPRSVSCRRNSSGLLLWPLREVQRHGVGAARPQPGRSL